MATLSLVAAAVWAAPTAFAQNQEPTSASIRVARKPVDLTLVAVTNRHTVPLVEWAITIYKDNTLKSPLSSVHDYRHQGPFQSGDGPIAPNETRRMRAARTGVLPTAVGVVTLAVFADGTYEGTPEMAKRFLEERGSMADDLAYWHGVLEALPRGSDDAAAAYLRTKAEERHKQHPHGVSGVRATVLGWLDPATPAQGGVRAAADKLRGEIKTRLDAARQFRGGPAAQKTGARGSTSGLRSKVTVAMEPSTGSDFVAFLENKKKVPLEAWQFDIFTSPTATTPRTNRGNDYTILLTDTKGMGRVQPGEVREISLGAAEDRPDSTMPIAKLTLAIWSDLSWEGSAALRDVFLKQREVDAERYAYWIEVVNAAAAKTNAEAIAHIRAKRQERRKTSPEELDLMLDHIVVWSARAAGDPTGSASWMKATADRFAKQRTLLLRHKK